MWIVRLIQSGIVTPDNKISPIQPRCHTVNIIRLADFEMAIEGLNIDKRCISIIELEQK